MTDRSSTESKTNRLLETSKTDNVETHHFKCTDHPLLQFSDVCQKEILKYENDIELDTSDPKIITLLKFISNFFRSPDPKGHVRYCHHLASLVRPLTFSYFNLLL